MFVYTIVGRRLFSAHNSTLVDVWRRCLCPGFQIPDSKFQRCGDSPQNRNTPTFGLEA